jgi:hypothetical protein
MTQAQKETACNMGKAAFINGSRCIPATDKSLMDLIAEINKFGEGAKLSKAWMAGWTNENLKREP